MPSYSSIKQFKDYIRTQLKEVMMDDVSKLGEKKLNDSIKNKIYNPQSEYSTGDFLNSVDSKIQSSVNEIDLIVFNNTNSMGSHPSLLSGVDQSKWLANWLNNGHGGLFTIAGYKFYEDAIESFKGEFKPTMIAGLKKRGIDSR